MNSQLRPNKIWDAEDMPNVMSEFNPLLATGPLTKDDAAVGRLFQSIIEVIAIAENEPEQTFCGFQLALTAGTDCQPLKITLVLCDQHEDGVITPRCA